jgi:hypothetical protein
MRRALANFRQEGFIIGHLRDEPIVIVPLVIEPKAAVSLDKTTATRCHAHLVTHNKGRPADSGRPVQGGRVPSFFRLDIYLLV